MNGHDSSLSIGIPTLPTLVPLATLTDRPCQPLSNKSLCLSVSAPQSSPAFQTADTSSKMVVSSIPVTVTAVPDDPAVHVVPYS